MNKAPAASTATADTLTLNLAPLFAFCSTIALYSHATVEGITPSSPGPV